MHCWISDSLRCGASCPCMWSRFFCAVKINRGIPVTPIKSFPPCCLLFCCKSRHAAPPRRKQICHLLVDIYGTWSLCTAAWHWCVVAAVSADEAEFQTKRINISVLRRRKKKRKVVSKKVDCCWYVRLRHDADLFVWRHANNSAAREKHM